MSVAWRLRADLRKPVGGPVSSDTAAVGAGAGVGVGAFSIRAPSVHISSKFSICIVCAREMLTNCSSWCDICQICQHVRA